MRMSQNILSKGGSSRKSQQNIDNLRKSADLRSHGKMSHGKMSHRDLDIDQKARILASEEDEEKRELS